MNSNILNLRHLTVLFILCTAFLGGAIPAFAQQGGKKMTGQVIDENKEPMIGVSILIVGTSTGTVTDAIDGEIAYLYNYNYSTQTSSIKTFNLKTGKTVRENFITDGTSIDTPYGINVNPYSGNVYITDAYDYTIYGDLLCFNQQGQLQFRLNTI